MRVIVVLLLAVLTNEATAIDFDTQIVPLLTVSGCNSGACHGAAAGRGGFRLSLMGGDADADYAAIVHQYEGRRVDLVEPERSLLFKKPTGYLDHGGGVVLDENQPAAQLMKAWIAGGAERGPRRTLEGLDVNPTSLIVDSVPSKVPLQIKAKFSDGSNEDVSRWTVFTVADPSAIEINSDQVATVSLRGANTVIARFLDRVVPIQLRAPIGEVPVDLSDEPVANFIDEEVLRTLTDLRIPVSPPAGEASWLRRVTLDLTGRLPTLETIDAFTQDRSLDKRKNYIQSLFQTPDYADYWTLRLTKILKVHSLPNEPEVANIYSKWLKDQIANDVGLNSIASDLLTASGDSHEIAAANFARMVRDPRGHAELVASFFMGVKLGCANCHNHPLDRWTQDDYHGLAAVFAKLDRGREVRWMQLGAVTNLRTNEPAVPRIPGLRYLNESADNRGAVADWLLAGPDHYFARATVNRLWKAMFGRGLVEPTDDIRDTNPASHPQLLKRLTDDFVAHHYSLRRTLELIASSHTYGRSDQVLQQNVNDGEFYSHAYRRPLMPEVLADAIADVTGIAGHYTQSSANGETMARAILLTDTMSTPAELAVLGRCTGQSGCDEDVASSSSLAAKLHLLNGELINRRLVDRKGRLQQMLHSSESDASIIATFYKLALTREPTEAELKGWLAKVSADDAKERRKRFEDFVWSLLNSRLFNQNY